MQRDDLGAIRARIPAGEHLTPDEWQLLMEDDSCACKIADLTLEYLVAVSNRKLHQPRRTREDTIA